MDTRERILQAAARVYAQHGFRGATTRLIAIEAGVNEVSLFRTFGSKAALFEAMMQLHASSLPVPELPDIPGDAHTEITAWCAALAALTLAGCETVAESVAVDATPATTLTVQEPDEVK